MGAFTAVSNITGVVVDSAAVSRRLHACMLKNTLILLTRDYQALPSHPDGALSIWDYASGVNSEDLAVNCPGDAAASKDALFFSGHKLVGAPASPGWIPSFTSTIVLPEASFSCCRRLGGKEGAVSEPRAAEGGWRVRVLRPRRRSLLPAGGGAPGGGRNSGPHRSISFHPSPAFLGVQWATQAASDWASPSACATPSVPSLFAHARTK